MRSLNRAITILLVSILLTLPSMPTATSTPPQTQSGNYTAQYLLLDKTLNLSIPPSLYLYYNNQSHTLLHDSDYARFITPQAVQSIADNIWLLTRNLSHPEEQFADEVLEFVHQIPYNITGAKYPIETLIDNRGDCGSLSLLAASIMKAGGLDVVLIKYVTPNFAHMNIGVYLPESPVYTSLFFLSTSLDFGNKTYWMAEATSYINWKVGDQPSQLSDAATTIIPVDLCEKVSPGEISSSLASLASSALTVVASSCPANMRTRRLLLISGSTEPKMQNNSVTLYINKKGSPIIFDKVVTNSNGDYTYLWNITSDGTYSIVASCNGNSSLAGSDSEQITVLLGPETLQQYHADTYDFIVDSIIGPPVVSRYLGVEEFLNKSIDANVSFSYSFIVLPTGHSSSTIQSVSMTQPSTEVLTRDIFGNTQTIQMATKTVRLLEIPPGYMPLALPGDFNETINNQFCFSIRQAAQGNYSLNAQGLNAYDIERLKNRAGSVFFNASMDISQNTWYKVAASTTKEGLFAELENENGSSIQALNVPCGENSSAQIALLVANDADSAIILRDFQVNEGNTSIQPASRNVHQLPPPMRSLLPFASTVMIIAIVVAATELAILVRRNRRQQRLVRM